MSLRAQRPREAIWRLNSPRLQRKFGVLSKRRAYDKLRQKFVFGIGYDDDIDHAKDVILDEVRQHDEIIKDSLLDIRVTELADSYVGLQTRFWIGEPGRGNFTRIRSELVQAVKERLDAEAIDMPYPVRTLEGSIEVTE